MLAVTFECQLGHPRDQYFKRTGGMQAWQGQLDRTLEDWQQGINQEVV